MIEITENVFSGPDCLQNLSSLISNGNYSEVVVLVDENSLKHCYSELNQLLPLHHIIEICSGEDRKNLEACSLVWEKLTSINADRKALLINLGGGVLLDLGGFAASCYKRGISFVNVPTTLLSMVDASVGGKTGIDFENYKNQIGLFSLPEAVYINSDFINTLPHREVLCGFAEVIKHYAIADENEFLSLLMQKHSLENMDWDSTVIKNVEIKSRIVQYDPKETGIRKALNFGHTVGHAVETYFLTDSKTSLLHGEAVAIGIICESYVSFRLDLISSEELDKVSSLIKNYFQLPVLPELGFNALIGLMMQDKKNIAGSINFTLLDGIGNYKIDNSVEPDVIIDSFRYYNGIFA